MLISETALTALAIKLASFSFFMSFIAPIISGENGVIILAFLSAQGYFAPWIVFLFGSLGMLAIDSIWFLLMKTKFLEKRKEKYRNYETYRKIEARIESLSHKSDIMIIMISKILIGTRILIIIYLSLRNISYFKFMKYNILPTFIWGAGLTLIGWLAGRGYYNLSQVSNNLFLGLTFIASLVMAFYLIMSLIRKWLIGKKV